jgi:hypothetical protein
MGKAKTFGFSHELENAEQERRAKKLVRKARDRFEISRNEDGVLFFYYIPKGIHGSQAQYQNGLQIVKWIETGRGPEPE